MDRGGVGRYLRLTLAAFLAVTAMAATGVLVWRGGSTLLPAASGVVAVMAAGLLVTAIQGLRSDRQFGGVYGLERSVELLALAVRAQWVRETAVRFSVDGPIPVRWHVGQADLGVHSGAGGAALADILRWLHHAKLIILGPPGSGKSTLAMQLTIQLLSRHDGRPSPVPVLLSVASWHPNAEALPLWIARRLAEDYPFLGDARRTPLEVARELVEDGRILPVLDGFDEIGGSLVPEAFAALHAMVGRPLVMTARLSDYEDAVELWGPMPNGVAVHVQPFGPADVVAALERGSWGDGQWAAVVEHVRGDPDGPLARVLATPLMLSLALRAYADPARSPTELIEGGSEGVIERRLLRQELNAAYMTSSTAPTVTSFARYPARRANHWLTFLARHLTRLRTRDLIWWDLATATPASARRLLVAAVCAAGTAWLSLQALSLAGAAIMLVAVVAAVGLGPPPSRVSIRSLAGVLILAVGAGAAVADAVGVVRAAITTAAFVLMGIARSYGAAAVSRPTHVQVPSPGTALARARSAALVAGAATALAFVTAAVFVAAAVDRDIVYLVAGVVVAALLGALVGASGTRWGDYLLARLWLAATGALPWRLTGFLADAHRRGVLRESGEHYQFRHILMQDWLAGVRRPSDQETPVTDSLFDALAVQHATVIADLPVRAIGAPR